MTGIILVDKEQGWTSSDVVAKLRGVLRERRIGHAGTLDPMATGVLVVMVGRGTRASEYLMRHEKKYRAIFRPGIVTDTQDTTGNILAETPCSITREQLEDAAKAFLGDIEQIPPMYSAIKIGGQKLYDMARRGEEVERPARKIHISSITVLGSEGSDWILDVECSFGTYIRTLCSDLGDKLGCGGCMAGLRRLSSGCYHAEDAYSVQQIVDAANRGEAEKLLLPLDSVFPEYREFHPNAWEEERILHGNPIKVRLQDGGYRVYSGTGEFLMLGRAEKGILKMEKCFFEVKQ